MESSRYIAIENMVTTNVPVDSETHVWPFSRFAPYARNPRKNDGAVDRMAASHAKGLLKRGYLNKLPHAFVSASRSRPNRRELCYLNVVYTIVELDPRISAVNQLFRGALVHKEYPVIIGDVPEM